jgi:predicted metal-dependent hydrolase
MWFQDTRRSSDTKRNILINSADGPIEIKQRINPRAKKLILRIDSKTGLPILTLPVGAKQKQIEQFIASHTNWIIEQIAKNSTFIVGNGDHITLADDKYLLNFTNVPPRKVTIKIGEGHNTITVGGPKDQAGKRLERWLRQEAKSKLTEASRYYADKLGVNYNGISIGDMKSRWGSCSSKGLLRYNWRLVMAPTKVMAYVAAHEVCHLLEMNHSDRFWAHVQSCMPDYKTRRKWLKTDGQNLMLIKLST